MCSAAKFAREELDGAIPAFGSARGGQLERPDAQDGVARRPPQQGLDSAIVSTIANGFGVVVAARVSRAVVTPRAR
jgi:hypothetical protein